MPEQAVRRALGKRLTYQNSSATRPKTSPGAASRRLIFPNGVYAGIRSSLSDVHSILGPTPITALIRFSSEAAISLGVVQTSVFRCRMSK